MWGFVGRQAGRQRLALVCGALGSIWLSYQLGLLRTKAAEGDGDQRTNNFYSQLAALDTKKVNLIYSPRYNIKFFGLEKFHPFDSCKYEKIYSALVQNGVVNKDETIEPSRVLTRKELEEVHTSSYLDTLSYSSTLASITEIGFVSYIPNFILQHVLLKPFLYATSGSVLSGHLAVEKGWAINLGGGFHHSSYDSGGGFCTYADITLCHKYLRKHHPKVKKIMIIDLDAHQGNGHEEDKIHFQDGDVFILDMYNKDEYPAEIPMAVAARRAINVDIPISDGTKDAIYLTRLESGLEKAFNSFKPDFIIYNAGTDILDGDPIGGLGVSSNGICKRDEMVFDIALKNGIPITMLLSGGYTQKSATVIVQSLTNLHQKYQLFK